MGWNDREAVMLRAIVEAEERGEDVNSAATRAVDLPDTAYFACVARLKKAGFIDAAIMRNGAGEIQVAHINRALPPALTEAGLWPTPAARADERKARRLAFMRSLYEMTGDNTLEAVDWATVAKPFGWTDEEANNVVYYLAHEGLVETHMGAQVSITHDGIVEVEEALDAPDQPTAHFPPAASIEQHFYGPVNASQIQAGSPGARQEMGEVTITPVERDLLTDLVTHLRRAAHEAPGSDRAGVAAARASAIEAELALPRPDRRILREVARSVRSIAEGMAGSGAWAGVAEIVAQLFT